MKHQNKSNLCTAGSSYIHIYPNGDIFRCMKDYNTRKDPITNINKIIVGDELFKKPLPCSHRICDVYCDADWSTKWLLEDEQVITKVPANEWDGVTSKHPWSEQEISSYTPPKYLSIVWTPALQCNYTCEYCGCAAGHKKIATAFPSAEPKAPEEQWMEVFKILKERYPWGYLQTNGGEPLLSPSTIPVLKLMSDQWAINLVTNGSIKITELVRQKMPAYNEKDDFGLSVTLSLHPSSRGFNWDLFLGKALMLKNEGYLRCINYVGWPEQLYLFSHYKKIFKEYDIDVFLQPWMGEDNRGFIGYTDAENKYVSEHVGTSRSSNTLLLNDYANEEDYSSILKIIDYSISKNSIHLTIDTQNAGTKDWDNENIKVGARLLKPNGNNIPVREYRLGLVDPLVAKSNIMNKFCIDLNGLNKEEYRLILDIVYEGKFWFSERGSKTIELCIKNNENNWKIIK
ncbi:hypothetical protein [Vibrio sp. MEBiC08052]|uniref:hypothetical protein n=1 Tax=Vibrio sp. MEBiC08052 TaxID=1761910 RepID=UPI00074063AC|nr:hypothetical protein [Vibrio sp. MEBiC08052]KUJ00625.1 hypothetical protein VRK_01270 [Vibrio sp. MEBiC08052]